jgi:hypothetical protein
MNIFHNSPNNNNSPLNTFDSNNKNSPNSPNNINMNGNTRGSLSSISASADGRPLRILELNDDVNMDEFAYLNRDKTDISSLVESLHSEKSLIACVEGEGYGKWNEVCDALYSSESNLKCAVQSAVNLIEKDNILSNLIPNIDINEINLGLNEITDKDKKSPFIAGTITKILDSIAELIGNMIIPSIRLFPQWRTMFEKIRYDRIKREGGKLPTKGDVEIDSQGVARVVINSDKTVDTDILHSASQRIDISIVKPEAMSQLDVLLKKRVIFRGELSCLNQYAYTATGAATYIQRNIRARFGRKVHQQKLKWLVFNAMSAAAVTLQKWVIAIQAKAAFVEAVIAVSGDRRDHSILCIQTCIRRWTKEVQFKRYIKNKIYNHWWFGITKMQGLIRGFNSRNRVKNIKSGEGAEKEAILKSWGVVIIQKIARGYIARNTIIKSLYIRKGLSTKVLKLAERYLDKGDLWGFLKEVNEGYERLNSELDNTEEREENWADTFVNKVMLKRQDQFDGAWNRFSQTANGKSRGGTSSQRLDTSNAMAEQDGRLTAMAVVDRNNISGWGDRKCSTKAGATRNGTGRLGTSGGPAPSPSRGGSNYDSSISGPLLRRAVTATVQEGVEREIDNQKNGSKFLVKLTEDIRDAYAPDHKKSLSKSKSVGNAVGSKIINSGSSVSSASVNSKTGGNVGRKTTGTATLKLSKKKTKGTGNISAVSSDWVSSTVKDVIADVGTTTLNGSPSKAKGTKNNRQLSLPWSGESLLFDIPRGIEDSLEKIMHAASIRCYVPDFFNGADAKESYQFYLILPPGLAKMRYEQESWKYSQGAINKLRSKGLTLIEHVMPTSKFVMFMKACDTPEVLLNATLQVVEALRRMGNIMTGLGHKPTQDQSLKLKEGKGTIAQVIAAKRNLGSTSPLRQTGMNTTQGDDDSAQISQDNSQTLLSPLGGKRTNTPGNSNFIETLPEKKGDPTLPSRLLVSLVEKGGWSNLQSSVEDLLVHAAFLVCPFTRQIVQPNGTFINEDSQMGHIAFKEHTAYIQELSEEDKREAVRSRFRSALIMATPFSLRLKADNVYTVKDLIKMNLNDYTMPAMFQAQVEALLSVSISMATDAKVAPTVRNHLTTNKELFTVPMLYNPKFQRSPFDPYGKPQHLGPLKHSIKTKSSAQRAQERAIAEEAKEIPQAIWIDKNNKQNKRDKKFDSTAEKLYNFKIEDTNENFDHLGPLIRQESLSRESNRSNNASREATPSFEGMNKEILSTINEYEIKVQSKEKKSLKRKEDDPATQRHLFLQRDFIEKVKSGFERPFKCTHPGCGQAFSRNYTLKVHEKSHALFNNYHEFKRQPQLFLDADSSGLIEERIARKEESYALPVLIQDELNVIESRNGTANGLHTRGSTRGKSRSSKSRGIIQSQDGSKLSEELSEFIMNSDMNSFTSTSSLFEDDDYSSLNDDNSSIRFGKDMIEDEFDQKKPKVNYSELFEDNAFDNDSFNYQLTDSAVSSVVGQNISEFLRK